MRAKSKYRFNLPIISVLVLLIGFFFRSLSARGEQNPAGGDDRPNILLIMADDWSWPHAGAYGDNVVRTPTFDRIARDGILFTHAFCPAPSCTPSRLSILTGQYPHRLNEGANHMVKFPKNYDVYPELLEKAGYHVGKYRKGANFGAMEGTGWEHDPAGRDFRNFAEFLDQNLHGKPFCFWFGSTYPHRPYAKAAADRRIRDIKVPDYLPDCDEVRQDLLNYYNELYMFDLEISVALYLLKVRNLLDNTIIIVTSDNGMPFPRGKCNCYDAGMRVPLAIMWPKRIAGGRVCDEMIHLSDIAPTILEAAGLSPTPDMTALSFLDLLVDSLHPQDGDSRQIDGAERRTTQTVRDAVFVERERHALGRGGRANSVSSRRGQSPSDRRESRLERRIGTLSYPIRGIRTKEYLFLVNFRHHLWPACDPPDFKDMGSSPSSSKILSYRGGPDSLAHYFELSCGKRPREELYDMRVDPFQLNNLAEDPACLQIKQELWTRLRQWMVETGDPRADGEDKRWDNYEWSPPTQMITPEQ